MISASWGVQKEEQRANNSKRKCNRVREVRGKQMLFLDGEPPQNLSHRWCVLAEVLFSSC